MPKDLAHARPCFFFFFFFSSIPPAAKPDGGAVCLAASLKHGQRPGGEQGQARPQRRDAIRAVEGSSPKRPGRRGRVATAGGRRPRALPISEGGGSRPIPDREGGRRCGGDDGLQAGFPKNRQRRAAHHMFAAPRKLVESQRDPRDLDHGRNMAGWGTATYQVGGRGRAGMRIASPHLAQTWLLAGPFLRGCARAARARATSWTSNRGRGEDDLGYEAFLRRCADKREPQEGAQDDFAVPSTLRIIGPATASRGVGATIRPGQGAGPGPTPSGTRSALRKRRAAFRKHDDSCFPKSRKATIDSPTEAGRPPAPAAGPKSAPTTKAGGPAPRSRRLPGRQ